MADVGGDNFDEFDQNLGIAEIEIKLVRAECAPDMAIAGRGAKRCQQWIGAGPGHQTQISVGIGGKIIVLAGSFI